MSRSDAVQFDLVSRTCVRDNFEVHALDDVTLRIPDHSFVAINLITGIDQPTAGHVSVGDEEIMGMNENDLVGARLRAEWRSSRDSRMEMS